MDTFVVRKQDIVAHRYTADDSGSRNLIVDMQISSRHDCLPLLSASCSNQGEYQQAREARIRAFELRDRVSERERFGIVAGYYNDVLGDLDKANHALELWAQTYPRASTPHLYLSNNYSCMGLYEKSLVEKIFAWNRRAALSMAT